MRYSVETLLTVGLTAGQAFTPEINTLLNITPLIYQAAILSSLYVMDMVLHTALHPKFYNAKSYPRWKAGLTRGGRDLLQLGSNLGFSQLFLWSLGTATLWQPILTGVGFFLTKILFDLAYDLLETRLDGISPIHIIFDGGDTDQGFEELIPNPK